jgi:hypothetical protein
MFIGNKSATVDIKVKVYILGNKKINLLAHERNIHTL